MHSKKQSDIFWHRKLMILKTPLRRQVGVAGWLGLWRGEATAWHTKEQGGTHKAPTGPAFCNGGYVSRGLGLWHACSHWRWLAVLLPCVVANLLLHAKTYLQLKRRFPQRENWFFRLLLFTVVFRSEVCLHNSAVLSFTPVCIIPPFYLSREWKIMWQGHSIEEFLPCLCTNNPKIIRH